MIRNNQKIILESTLYMAVAGLLWYDRKVISQSSPTLQYSALAISHVAFSALLDVSLTQKGNSDNRLLNDLFGIATGSMTVFLANQFLKKSFSWIKPDAAAFWETTTASALVAIFVNMFMEGKKPPSDKPTYPMEAKHEKEEPLEQMLNETLGDKPVDLGQSMAGFDYY